MCRALELDTPRAQEVRALASVWEARFELLPLRGELLLTAGSLGEERGKAAVKLFP